VFLHDALLEAYLYGNTAIPAKGLKRQVWQLTQDNQQTGITGMEEEFNVCLMHIKITTEILCIASSTM